MKFKISLALILIFATMQLFTIEKIPFEEPNENDFLLVENSNEEVELILKTICYDCHSNQINYPWYSNIAPISWWINDHVEEGREHLNFSEWANYKKNKKAHKAEEAWEEVEEKEMPLESYTLIHRDANLSSEQRDILVNYFKAIQDKYSQ